VGSFPPTPLWAAVHCLLIAANNGTRPAGTTHLAPSTYPIQPTYQKIVGIYVGWFPPTDSPLAYVCPPPSQKISWLCQCHCYIWVDFILCEDDSLHTVLWNWIVDNTSFFSECLSCYTALNFASSFWSKIVVMRCHISRLNAPNSISQCSPNPLTGFKGSYF